MNQYNLMSDIIKQENLSSDSQSEDVYLSIRGFSVHNLRNMHRFYLTFPKRQTVCAELSWSHYQLLMQIQNETKREFYMQEAKPCCTYVFFCKHMAKVTGYARVSTDSDGYFQEGLDAFAGVGIKEKFHVKICVSNTDCIKGCFTKRKMIWII